MQELLDYAEWKCSINLAWKWTTPPSEKKMGVFTMICTIAAMENESNVLDSLHLIVYRPGIN